MSYAEKVNVTGPFLKALNNQPSSGPASCGGIPHLVEPTYTAPMMENFEGKPPQRTASRGVGAGGMQNVGNSIGEIPSVKLHAPPGSASQVMFG